MFTITRWIAAPAVALAIMMGSDAPEAQADHGRHLYRSGFRGLSINIGSGHVYRNYYSVPYTSRLHHSRGYGFYHDTSHYDYHGPSIIRHGNHWHVQPGHYHLHRSGHWH